MPCAIISIIGQANDLQEYLQIQLCDSYRCKQEVGSSNLR